MDQGCIAIQSIWKGNTPVFMGKEYAGLSKTALYYIGGILKHAKAINAFLTQQQIATRLMPGFEAPVIHSMFSKK